MADTENENKKTECDDYIDVEEDYKNLVMKAEKEGMDLFIRNSTFEHALFLSKTLIDRAEKYIKIYTGCLSELFYDHKGVKKSLIDSLTRGVVVEIVVERDLDRGDENKIMELENTFEKLTINRLNDPPGPKNHFLLSDTSAFRVEKEHGPDEFKKENFKVFGEANFNNAGFANKLLTAFNVLKQNSTPI